MAKLEKLLPLILKWEGGYVNDLADKGGPTNKGVTLATWQTNGYDLNGDGKIDEEDLQLINQENLRMILKKHYWDKWRGDEIANQSIANILVDWVWLSGRYGIVLPQKLLGVKQDGIVGNQTLQAVNGCPNPQVLFEKIKTERRNYLYRICENSPVNKRFLKGWLNRLADFQYAS